ncbi:YciI family protein [Leifsonia sp. fls2-241-R2A-40a]|uniref:YciI family protein n=1 Tax=Leifsonia sp. fls2-241-R2A-40a TaxID=3040290 RepID=UPI00254C0780|nr:YciI family protein [Leifsonia sp. fls2-241-R2A-40a]
MRFVLMALADDGDPAALDGYERELVRAGVLLAAEALEPADAGACLRFEGEERILSRIPSGHQPTAGDVTGIWMLQTAGEDEALEWARRLPLTRGTVEVRRVAGDAGR